MKEVETNPAVGMGMKLVERVQTKVAVGKAVGRSCRWSTRRLEARGGGITEDQKGGQWEGHGRPPRRAKHC